MRKLISVLLVTIIIVALLVRIFMRFNMSYNAAYHRVMISPRRNHISMMNDAQKQRLRQSPSYYSRADVSVPYLLIVLAGSATFLAVLVKLAQVIPAYIARRTLWARPLFGQLFNNALVFYRRPPPVELCL